MRLVFGLPLLALTIPLAAHAQSASPLAGGAAKTTPKDIVVLGTGLPLPPGTPAYGSTVITDDRLENDASGRTEDILKDVAGFQEYRRSDSRSANPSAQGVTLRALGGNATSRTLVLLDGVPQADPFFGYIPFNALTPDRLSAVRVTRGGGAGAFGAGAVAGVIEMVSATRDELPPVNGSLFYGSRNAVMASSSVSPDLGAGFVSISGDYDRGDGYYTTPEDQRVPASARARYEDWSVNLRAVVPLSAETEIQARALVYRDNRTLRFDGADSSSQAQDASIRLIHRGPWAIDALAYLQTRNFSNKVISSSSYKLVLDQRNTPSTGMGGKLELRPPVGGRHVLRIGMDARLADGELYENPYSAQTGRITATHHAGGRSSTIGVFVEDDWKLGKLIVTGALRGDRWTISDGFYDETDAAGNANDQRYPDRDGFMSTVRAGALYHVTGAISLRAAGYTGFRLPTLNELYRPFTVYPVVTEANADLGLEKLKGVEAGMDLAPIRGMRFGVTAFYNRLDGAIDNVTIGENLRQRRNVKAIVVKGIEFTTSIRRGPFSLSASYAYDHSIVRGAGDSIALDGYVPAQSPRQNASATLGWRARSGAALSTTIRYVDKQYEDDLETDVIPSALTVDMVAQLPLGKGISLIGRVENLFDATVVTGNADGAIDLGTPQTFLIGFRFKG